MIKLQTLGLAAALGLAGAVLAQTPSPSTTTSTDSQTSTSTSSTQDQDTMGQSQGSPTDQSTTQGSTGTPPISDSDTSGTSQTMPTTSEEDPASAESESTRIAAAGDTSKSKDKHRVSKLIGKNVETSTGESIGEVKDVIVDDQAQITHFIISHGRLGSTKMAAVPYETVKQMMKGDKIVFERTRLENAPSFEESNFPNLASATWSSSADRYWGRSRTAAAESSTGASSETSSSDTSSSGDLSSSSSTSTD